MAVDVSCLFLNIQASLTKAKNKKAYQPELTKSKGSIVLENPLLLDHSTPRPTCPFLHPKNNRIYNGKLYLRALLRPVPSS